MDDNVVKVTFNITEKKLKKLTELAKRRKLTVTNALEAAIDTELFFHQELAEGNAIKVIAPDGTVSNVRFTTE